MDTTRTYRIENLDCAACAAKLETTISKQPGVDQVALNYLGKQLTIEANQSMGPSFWKKLEETILQEEQDVRLTELQDQQMRTYTFSGIDCPVCAQKVEEALRTSDGVLEAQVDFAAKQVRIKTEGQKDQAFHDQLIAKAKKVEPSLVLKADQPMQPKVMKFKIHRQVRFWRIVFALLFFAVGLATQYAPLYLVSYLIAGYDVLAKAGRNLLHLRLFDEYFLMSIATLGAVAITEYGEAAAVMLFYLVGEFFQETAVTKSRDSIVEALHLKSEEARVVTAEGTAVVHPTQVAPGTTIRVLAGEKIPLDGTVVQGSSTLDTQSLTGESLPFSCERGDEVLSGSVNLSASLDILTTKAYEESTATKILHLVEESSARKAPTERFITTFARYYTPVVVVLALALALVPSLFTGDWGTWTYRALVFLVVSCPCALVISVPLTFFSGIGRAAREGMLVKGGNYLEALAKADTLVFDKTGTLTRGVFSLTGIQKPDDSPFEDSYLLALAASVERQSTHPLARAFDAVSTQFEATEVKEFAGKGLTATVDGLGIAAGNAALMHDLKIPLGSQSNVQTSIHLAIEGKVEAVFLLEDTQKSSAPSMMQGLRGLGIRTIIMLSGDTEAQARKVSDSLGLDGWYAGLLPHQKQQQLEILAQEHPNLVFIGDGINDAPSLASSKVGVAFGAKASDAAIESADVVILRDDLSVVTRLLDISRKSASIVRQNIVLALSVKALALVLGALGFASMWMAVIADTGLTIVAVLNSLRILLSRPSR
ncbi:MAG: cadmium-translocating P-type ATPase [Spirochaetia bacterium]|nr:cadmium-translocating P-type ATPase [Spirochaetia bacterium]NCC89406.1 cadmium-translocating P-type ATPase [Spirochaetia bacterium]